MRIIRKLTCKSEILKPIFYKFVYKFLYKFFSDIYIYIYIYISKNLSTKYYPISKERKERLQKKSSLKISKYF